MLNRAHKARWMNGAAMAAALLLCVSAVSAQGPRSGAPAHRDSQPSRSQGGRTQPSRPQFQDRSPMQDRGRSMQSQGGPQANGQRRSPYGGYPGAASRPGYPPPGYPGRDYPGQGYPGQGYPGSPYVGPGYSRPAYPGYADRNHGASGHLGDWLNQHRNLPIQEQERTLRGDPSFRRLSPGDQQRVVQQLRQVNRLPEQQQQRREARTQMIERLSPLERMQVNNSARRWAAQPPERQALMKNTFRDLRAVPLDQRQTVLGSARYQRTFTPEERGILSDLLRVEPYEPTR
jgi:hypothetical protein